MWLGAYLTTPQRSRLRRPRPFFLAPVADCDRSNRGSRSSKGEVADGEEEEEWLDARGSPGDEDEGEDEDEDEDEDGLPRYLLEPHRVASHRLFASPACVVDAFLARAVQLRRTEGTRAAHVGGLLFVEGRALRCPEKVAYFMTHNNVLSPASSILSNFDAREMSALTR